MQVSGRIALPVLTVLSVLLCPCIGSAAWPLVNLTGKRVDASSQNSYTLTEQNGPWLIMTAAFAGEGSEAEARGLVLELRNRFKLSAFMHAQHYDLSQPVVGLGLDMYGNPKKMRHRQQGAFNEYAVLVGDFPTLVDRKLEKTLKQIKYLQPSTIDLNKNSDSTLRFAGLRALHKKLSGNEAKRTKGPLGKAFATRNPLLPEEYFVPKGVDNLVAGMNQGVTHSLLNCPGKYTVRVASFRGNVIIDQNEVKKIESTGKMKSRLAQAAEKAAVLTKALRDQGVEAYEFHDRHESIVTVGSFDSVGKPRADGRIEINPDVLRLMKKYGPEQRSVGGQANVGLMPRAIRGIPFDIQPTPIEVPKRSIAADYVARGTKRVGQVRQGGSVR